VTRRALILAVLVVACDRKPAGVVAEAKFGVFFGGQVQQLQEIPKELDPGRQSHGFRVSFRGPLVRDVQLSWELSLPVPEQGGPRAALVGQVTAKAGQTLLDVPLAFRASDPLGVWHARLHVGGQLAVDRDFTLVAPTPQKSAPKSGPRRPLSPEQ
jgi:hypothetical protein